MIILGASALAPSSCRDMIEPERPEDYWKAGANDGTESTCESIFESYWTGMNNNCLFRDIFGFL
jgi:hypothetical protein